MEKDALIRFSVYRYEDDLDTLYIADVYVDKQARGKGRGNEILRAATETAKAMGAKQICLKALDGSCQSAWYIRHGFVAIEKQGKYIWMIKSLTDGTD